MAFALVASQPGDRSSELDRKSMGFYLPPKCEFPVAKIAFLKSQNDPISPAVTTTMNHVFLLPTDQEKLQTLVPPSKANFNWACDRYS